MQGLSKYVRFWIQHVLFLVFLGAWLGPARGQQVSVGYSTYPITVSVDSSSEITINSGGNVLLEDGEIFRADRGVHPVWERVRELKVA